MKIRLPIRVLALKLVTTYERRDVRGTHINITHSVITQLFGPAYA